jgi:hypothetical protein
MSTGSNNNMNTPEQTLTPDPAGSSKKIDDEDLPSIGRYRELSWRWRAVMATLTGVSILLAINQIFNLGFLMIS